MCHCCERMYLCGFVDLSPCVFGCVLQGPIRGTMSLCSGTNEILASKHDIAAIKVKQGHFETAILVFHNLPSSITAKSE